MSNWQNDFVETNGIRVHYTRTGGDKPALVLLHGITDNGLCWGRVARALEADYDILMVDARGHGLSDKPENGYHSDDYAADFAGLIEALGLGPALVMGHSLGANNAATLAANYPKLVRAAVLEDPPWFDLSGQQRRSAEEEAKGMDEWRAGLIAQQEQALEEIIAAGKKRSPKWSEDEFPAWAQAKKQVYPFVLGKSSLRTWDDIVPQIACPTLLVTGDSALGALVAPGLAAKVCAVDPKIEHAHIPDAGHNIRRENFDAFLAAIRTFLADLSE